MLVVEQIESRQLAGNLHGEHDGTHDGRLFERLQFALGWFSQVLELQG